MLVKTTVKNIPIVCVFSLILECFQEHKRRKNKDTGWKQNLFCFPQRETQTYFHQNTVIFIDSKIFQITSIEYIHISMHWVKLCCRFHNSQNVIYWCCSCIKLKRNDFYEYLTSYVNKNLSDMSSTITSKQADAPRFVSVTFNLKTYKPLDAFFFFYVTCAYRCAFCSGCTVRLPFKSSQPTNCLIWAFWQKNEASSKVPLHTQKKVDSDRGNHRTSAPPSIHLFSPFSNLSIRPNSNAC